MLSCDTEDLKDNGETILTMVFFFSNYQIIIPYISASLVNTEY